MLSDNVQYEIAKPHTVINSTGNKKLIPSKTYASRELLPMLKGMTAFTQFVSDDRVIKKKKLRGITEMILNLNKLDNSDNLEDGRSSSTLLTYHVSAHKIL